MIPVSVDTALALYMLVTLGGLCLVMILESVRQGNQEWRTSEERLAFCSDCKNTFIVARTANVARCPRCTKICRVGRKSS